MATPTRRSWARIGLLTAITASAISAQPAQPTIRSVTYFTVKADRVADYLAAAKDYVALMKKGGSERSLSNWQSLSGPREYALVRYHTKWSELDETREAKLDPIRAEVTATVTRIYSTVESSRRVIYGIDAELSLPLPMGEPPAMARVLRQYVRPDQLNNVRALIKSDVLPAIKKSGAKLYSVARPRFGGSNFEINSVTNVDKWADLDGEAPLVTAMGGQANYEKFLAKLRPMVVRSEYEMYRFLKEQSYTAPAK